MLPGAGVLAFATPAPSPRAEMASVPAIVASAISFFALIFSPLSGAIVFNWRRWIPRLRAAQTGFL
jgi:hypothetical protein